MIASPTEGGKPVKVKRIVIYSIGGLGGVVFSLLIMPFGTAAVLFGLTEGTLITFFARNYEAGAM